MNTILSRPGPPEQRLRRRVDLCQRLSRRTAKTTRTPSTTLLLTCLALMLVAMVTAQSERNAEILRNDYRIDPEEGTYQTDMETSNNIRMRSSGISYKGDRPDSGSVYVEGEASWITPDGKTVLLKYTSDEGGYSPVVSISSK